MRGMNSPTSSTPAPATPASARPNAPILLARSALAGRLAATLRLHGPIAWALAVADHAVLAQLVCLSGYTLTHIAAAGAAGWLLHGAWRAVRTDQLR